MQGIHMLRVNVINMAKVYDVIMYTVCFYSNAHQPSSWLSGISMVALVPVM